MHSKLFKWYLRISKFNEPNGNLNLALRLRIPSHYPLHNIQHPTLQYPVFPSGKTIKPISLQNGIPSPSSFLFSLRQLSFIDTTDYRAVLFEIVTLFLSYYFYCCFSHLSTDLLQTNINYFPQPNRNNIILKRKWPFSLLLRCRLATRINNDIGLLA